MLVNSVLAWAEIVVRAVTSSLMIVLNGTPDLALTDSFIRPRARCSSPLISRPKARRSATAVT